LIILQVLLTLYLSLDKHNVITYNIFAIELFIIKILHLRSDEKNYFIDIFFCEMRILLRLNRRQIFNLTLKRYKLLTICIKFYFNRSVFSSQLCITGVIRNDKETVKKGTIRIVVIRI